MSVKHPCPQEPSEALSIATEGEFFATEDAPFQARPDAATLFFAIAAYLGVVIALVGAWERLHAMPGEEADLAHYLLAGLLALPVPCFLLLNLRHRGADTHNTFWRVVRPWLTPAAIALAFGVGWALPSIEKGWDIEALNRAGFIWMDDARKIQWANEPNKHLTSLLPLRPQIQRLQPDSLWIYDCQALNNLDGIQGVTSLREIDIRACALQNVDAIKGLVGLRELDFRHCNRLQDVNILKSLAGLKTLKLSGLQNTASLRYFTRLKFLDLSECHSLQNLDALKALHELKILSLYYCTELQDVEALKGLTGLQFLDLVGCEKIPATALYELSISIPKTDILFPDYSRRP